MNNQLTNEPAMRAILFSIAQTLQPLAEQAPALRSERNFRQVALTKLRIT